MGSLTVRSLTKFMALMALACALLFSTGIARADGDHNHATATPCGSGPISVELLKVTQTNGAFVGTFKLCNTTNAAITGVGVATYAIVQPIGCPGTVTEISSQLYVDSETGLTLDAGECETVELKMARCFNQVDVFTGPVITNFQGSDFYGYNYPAANANPLRLKGGAYVSTESLHSLHDVSQADLEDCVCTFTQGGYQQLAHGNNVGAFLRAYFDIFFPNGVTIGIPDANQITSKTFTTPDQIRAFLLETKGKPSTLPTKSIFAAQVLTLSLNFGFNAGFGDLEICSGLGEGKTVAEILAIANTVLGGGTVSGYTISSLNELVTNLNESFDNCNESEWAKKHLCGSEEMD